MAFTTKVVGSLIDDLLGYVIHVVLRRVLIALNNVKNMGGGRSYFCFLNLTRFQVADDLITVIDVAVLTSLDRFWFTVTADRHEPLCTIG